MATDTSEKGLERLICTALTGAACDPGAVETGEVRERPAAYGAGWICGAPEDYDREHCVDLVQLSTFLLETQPDVAEALDLGQDGPTRRAFLARLEASAGVRPILYFTGSAHRRILDGHFESYPVWPRSMVLGPSESRFGPWLFWQFADNGRVPGVRSLVDLNVFRGNEEEFQSLVRAPDTPGA